VRRNAPSKFCVKPRSRTSRLPDGGIPPALWISTSIERSARAPRPRAGNTSAASPMSARRNSTDPPVPRIPSTAAAHRG
jgi:hypothetical protein